MLQSGMDFVSSVSCKQLAGVPEVLDQTPTVTFIPSTKEDEGMGLCAGAFLGGMNPAIIMQDTAFGAVVNTLATLIDSVLRRDHALAEPEAIERVDILVVNRLEAAQHAGLDETALDAERAAERLIERGPTNVIVTLGGVGFLACTEDACFELPAIDVDVVSTRGAGDAFIEALAAELTRMSYLRLAAEFAQAAAALTVSTRQEYSVRLDRKKVLDFK